MSDHLLTELERAPSYPKLRERVGPSEAIEFLELSAAARAKHDDSEDPPKVRSPDPGDDYLIALAELAQAMIVSGDGHLLGLAGQVPVFSPVEFLAELDRLA